MHARDESNAARGIRSYPPNFRPLHYWEKLLGDPRDAFHVCVYIYVCPLLLYLVLPGNSALA